MQFEGMGCLKEGFFKHLVVSVGTGKQTLCDVSFFNSQDNHWGGHVLIHLHWGFDICLDEEHLNLQLLQECCHKECV